MEIEAALKNLASHVQDRKTSQVKSLSDINWKESPNYLAFRISKAGEIFLLVEQEYLSKKLFLADSESFTSSSNFSIKKDIDFKQAGIPKKTVELGFTRSKVNSTGDFFSFLKNNTLSRTNYRELYELSPVLDYSDVLVLVNHPADGSLGEAIVIQGPARKGVPESAIKGTFLEPIPVIKELRFVLSPTAYPALNGQFVSYRDVRDGKVHLVPKSTMKSNEGKNVANDKIIAPLEPYLESIWLERTGDSNLSSIKLLVENAVFISESTPQFKARYMKGDLKSKQGIPSNFVIGLCGGYARDEFSKHSDLDLCLIHEGNIHEFYVIGKTLHDVLDLTPGLELCSLESLPRLNFHVDDFLSLIDLVITGDMERLPPSQKKEAQQMIKSVSTLRKKEMSTEEQLAGIRKLCWSYLKSVLDMIPVYDRPIGKGMHVRDEFHAKIRRKQVELLEIVKTSIDFLNDSPGTLRKRLTEVQLYYWDSVFKRHSALTCIQDIGTFAAIFGNFALEIRQTSARLSLAAKKGLIKSEDSKFLIKAYDIFRFLKYLLEEDWPLDELEIINNEVREVAKRVFNTWIEEASLKRAEDEISKKQQSTGLERPLLIFSDLHWGQKSKLERKALENIRKVIKDRSIATVLVTGDLLNIDIVQQIQRTGNVQSLLEELRAIKRRLGVDNLYLLNGNHDTSTLYEPWKEQLEEKAGVKYLGSVYQDEQVRVEHGNEFWDDFLPPMSESLEKYRQSNGLGDQHLVMGHRHVIHEDAENKMYSNGPIGKHFSVTIADGESVELFRMPVEFQIDVNNLMKQYEDYINAEELIDQHVSNNVIIIAPSTTLAQLKDRNLKTNETLIVMDGNEILGLFHVNILEKMQIDISSEIANALQVVELASPAIYTLQLGQALKVAWTVFSVTGETTLPVMDGENSVVGKLSIFSIPKAEMKQAEPSTELVDKKMSEFGSKLDQFLKDRE
ncbi:MAG: metallophosphoesterase family protein [Candidatus Hodarchaeales archaeon]